MIRNPFRRPHSICLFAPFLWPLFSPTPIAFAGGAEVQQAAIARGLVRRGFRVSSVTMDFGQPDGIEVDGIRFYRSHRDRDGVWGLRFLHPRLTGYVRALSAADADLYYVRGSGGTAGLAHDLARLRGAAFVFAAAHDYDAMRSVPKVQYLRDRLWYRRAVRGADAVIAQTESQRRMFAEQFGLDARVIPNLVEPPRAAPAPGRDGTVLWLSTYKPSKRPEWAIELARRLPHRRVVMMGVVPPPPLTRESWDMAQAAARELPNLEVHGHVPREDVASAYAGAALFLHTSGAEGFANTMLEAWSQALPTIVAVDPDGVTAQNGMGEFVADLAAMTDAVERWMSDPARRAAAATRARKYVREHHDPGTVIDRIAELFEQVITARRG